MKFSVRARFSVSVYVWYYYRYVRVRVYVRTAGRQMSGGICPRIEGIDVVQWSGGRAESGRRRRPVKGKSIDQHVIVTGERRRGKYTADGEVVGVGLTPTLRVTVRQFSTHAVVRRTSDPRRPLMAFFRVLSTSTYIHMHTYKKICNALTSISISNQKRWMALNRAKEYYRRLSGRV